MKKIRIGLLVAGVKGLNFLKAFPSHEPIDFVGSYPFKGLRCQPVDETRAFCTEKGIRYYDSKELTDGTLTDVDVVFVAGWQFLLKVSPEKLVVLHDSLLPKFRGFAPTLNALIRGEKKVGVTAFKPVAAADAGPVYEQASLAVTYPVKIGDVYAKLGHCYAKCAAAILAKMRRGRLKPKPQDEKKATYSIWRGPADLFVNWEQEAPAIRRFVDALSWPYEGARTLYMGKEIILDEVHPLPERRFELRHAGKIWALSDNQPEVVCGKGMIRILSARNPDGSMVSFQKLRERLGTRPESIIV